MRKESALHNQQLASQNGDFRTLRHIPDDALPDPSAVAAYQKRELATPYLPAATRPLWQQIFFGTDGLRAGWGLLVFFLLISLLSAGINSGVRAFRHQPPKTAEQRRAAASKPLSPTAGVPLEGANFALVAIATWIMSRIERRRIGVYGFGGTRKLSHFLLGFAWGLLFLGALVGSLWKFGMLVFDGRLLSGVDIFRYGAVWLLMFLLVGCFEEYLLRGYLQFTLSRGIASLYKSLFDTTREKTLGFWTSAAVLSFIFGFGHGNNPGESPIGLVSAGLIGLIFCLTLWRTGSLWWALGFHAAWDWAQSFLFGVADSGMMVQGPLLGTHPVGKVLLSGGSTGPEGSIFILPVLGLVALVVVWTVPKTSQTRSVAG